MHNASFLMHNTLLTEDAYPWCHPERSEGSLSEQISKPNFRKPMDLRDNARFCICAASAGYGIIILCEKGILRDLFFMSENHRYT